MEERFEQVLRDALADGHDMQSAIELVFQRLDADAIKESDFRCPDCSVNIRMRFYQYVYAEKLLALGKRWYSGEVKCPHGCSSRCLHGFSALLAWEQRVGKTPAFLFFLHRLRSFLKAEGDNRWRKPILILALAKNEGDIVGQAKTFLPQQDFNKIVQLSGQVSQLQQLREMFFDNPLFGMMPDLLGDYVLVGHYDSLGHSGADPFCEALNAWDFLMLVLDQGERAQNEDTTRSKAVEGIARDATIVVTGEPLNNANRPEYLWELLQHIQPGVHKSGNDYVPSSSCTAGSWVNKKARQSGCKLSGCDYLSYGRCQLHQDKYGSPLLRQREPSPVFDDEKGFYKNWWNAAHQHAIHRLVRNNTNYSRLTREELKFPPIELKTLEIAPTAAQRENYLALLEGIRRVVTFELSDGGLITDPQVLDERMSQSVSNNVLVMRAWLTQALQLSPRTMAERSTGMRDFREKVRMAGGDMVLESLDGQSAKIDTVIKIFQKMPYNDKLIVFSHYIGFLDQLADELKHKGLAFSMLTGSTPKGQIQKQIDQFSKERSCRVFIASDAASAGIPMQGGLEDGDVMHVIFPGFPYWNPATMQECGSRPYEMGMKNTVEHLSIVGMVNGHSIDLLAAQGLAGKRAVSNRIQDGEKVRGNIYENLSYSDFLDMIRKLSGE